MVESYIQQLVNYLKNNLSKGYTLESLKWALVNQGYGRSEINRAVKLVNEELAKSAPLLKEKPVIKIKREPLLDEIAPLTPTFSSRLKDFFRSLKEIFKS